VFFENLIHAKTANLVKATAGLGSSGETLGFSGDIQLDIDASITKNKEESTTRKGSTLFAGGNLAIQSGKTAKIEGSDLGAEGELSIDAEDVEITAARNTNKSSSSTRQAHINGSYSTNGSWGVNADASFMESSSESTWYTNSHLSANNIIIKSSKDTTVRGGVVTANNTLDLNVGGNLLVESLQDKSTSGSHSLGLSAGYSSGKDGSGINVGGNFSVSSSTKKWVCEQTSLTGNSVNIYVENKTTLKGAVIASTSNDLTLNTGSFEYIHIKDKDISYNAGAGVNLGSNSTGKPEEKNNTWSVNASYGISQKRQTNFATIGEGTIIVRDGNTDLSKLNRDVTKAQYGTVDIGLKGGVTVDSSTVAFVTNPVGEIKNAITSLEKGYNDAKKTTVDQYQRTSNYMNDRGYYTNGEITKIGVDAALAVFTPDISQVKGSPNDKNIYDFLHEIYAGKISGNYDGKVASATLQQVASLYGMSSAEFKDAYQRGVIGNEFGNDITKILADNIDLDNAVADYSRRQVAIYEKQKLLANNQKDSSSTSLASTGVLVFGLAEGSTSLLPEGIAQTLTKINPITACGSLIFLQGDGDQRANSQDQKTSLATLAEFAKENPEQYLATYIVAKSYTENPALFQGDKLPVLVPEVILSDQPELLRLLPNNRQVDTENKNNTITTPRNDISVKDNLITTPGNYDAPLIKGTSKN